MAEVQVTFSDEIRLWADAENLGGVRAFAEKYRPLLSNTLADNFYNLEEATESDAFGILEYLADRSYSTRDRSPSSRAVLALINEQAGGETIPAGWGSESFPVEFFADLALFCKGELDFRVEVIGFDEYTNVCQSPTPEGWFVDNVVTYEWDEDSGEYLPS